MKKRGVVLILLIILFSCSVFANKVQNSDEGVQRFTDFETDNIHILRIQNFSMAVVTEIEKMHSDLDKLDKQLVEIKTQIAALKSQSGGGFQDGDADFSKNVNQITAQLVGIENEINYLKGNKGQTILETTNSLVITLNILIFVVAIATFFFVRKNIFFDTKKQAEMHAQLHLDNAVKNAIKNGISVDKVRHTFLSQGWSNERIDMALHEAIKK